MKRSIYYSFLLSAALVAGMTSCSDENDVFGSQGRNVTMTVNINRGEMATRSVLTEEDGDLKCTWEASDLVLVVDNTGKKLGVLKLESGAGQQSATFKGTLTTDAEGDTDVTFLYLGNTSEAQLKALESPVTIDYSAQDGTLDWLIDHDFFSATENVNVDLSSIEVESVSLLRQLSFGKFEIALPEGVTYNGEAIEISGPGVYTNASVSLTEGTTFSNNGKIIITRPENTTSTEFYVAILPTSESITPTFSTTVDGQKYSYTLDARTWAASEFVRKDNGDGTFSGMQLNMTASSDLYGEYENEDPRNPLHKFAKYNLVRVGERGSLINGFADSEYENGALYQWGRNYGYMDTNGIYREEIVSPGTDFTNFIDALGRFDDPDAEYDRILDYFVYNPRPNQYFMTSGTAMRYTPQHPQYVLWYDAPNFYTSVDDIKANPDKYFMDGTPGSRYCGYGNLAIGMEQKNEKPDYWLSSFGDGGSTWEKRAEKCGYEKTNPCPTGWKLPSLEDFKEIAPEGRGLDANKSMASMLSNYCEVRKTKDGVNYVIRWIYDSSAITIEAVVVENSISKSEVTSKFWDDNRDKKVVRVFPFTGSIVPLICLSDGRMMANVEYIVRPHHRGFLDYIGFQGGYGASNNYYWMLIGPDNNGGAPFGGYWIDEKNNAFKFEAKEIEHGVNTSNSTFTATSCLFVGSAEPVMGYAIRPVMDTTAK